ncbi:Helix-turn-helix domain protein [Gemmata sp. SH-PL17]|uniref:helix-turn-helix domain-containing protein n=1 Tax=Gemmata sp. SH-PL17 TaxID=1630693 RepID=UPI00078D87EC|nr:Helix-turn-helix domain protein [Gemmata sp. SH-PL17]
MNSPAYLTIAQAALRACVSESMLYEACRRKLVVHYRPGVNGRGKILFLPEDVDAWMAAFRIEAPKATQGEDELTFLK